MENRKSTRLYMIAHTIELSNRESTTSPNSEENERRHAGRVSAHYRGPERREELGGAGVLDVVGEDEKFLQVSYRPLGHPPTTVRLPKWKLFALEEELAIKNASTLGRLIESCKFRAGDRPALMLLLQRRGHQVLGEFVISSQLGRSGSARAS